MKCWNHCFWLVLSVATCIQSRTQSSSVDSINMKITNTSSIITVTWEAPDKSKVEQCYKSHLQYRSHCESSWKSVKDIYGFSFVLPAPDMKKNYVFRIKMSLACIGGRWSKWSAEKYWRNDTVLCIAETSYNIKDYLLVTLLPLIAFLLLFAITQERVRRIILPIIPDPKHIKERILNIEQLQFVSFTQACEECEIAEIEMINMSEEEKTEIRDEPPPKPAASVSVSHDRDLPVQTADNTTTQCSHTIPGYIVL